jgi:hypothetical protein
MTGELGGAITPELLVVVLDDVVSEDEDAKAVSLKYILIV